MSNTATIADALIICDEPLSLLDEARLMNTEKGQERVASHQLRMECLVGKYVVEDLPCEGWVRGDTCDELACDVPGTPS
jgi:hypothetical protein